MAEGNIKSHTVKTSQVKEEDDGDTTTRPSHKFTVDFKTGNKYQVFCDKPLTVLEAIKSNSECKKKMKKMKWEDEKTIIRMGCGDKESAIATHFPGFLVSDGELLTVSCKKRIVEKGQDHKIDPNNKYIFFYIDTKGGHKSMCKINEIVRHFAVKRFKYLCVYGEEGMTVKEALKRDGRFTDDMGEFKLSDNETKNIISCTEKVKNIDKKKLKIIIETEKTVPEDKEGQENQGAANRSEHKPGTKAILDAAQQTGISVKRVVEKSSSDETEEIYELLRQQFPELKEIMESRFTENSYQEELKLRTENFGKIQQSFSEVHRVKDLLKLGRSVCKVVVEGVCTGTGFVLFDNFILTNAHLFKNCVEGEKLQDGINVFALFNYDKPEPNTNYYYFSSKTTFNDFDRELDYAILELNTQAQKHNIKLKKNIKIPPGLLKEIGPVPQNGEACIIGHPKGEVKKMDPTCIIETEKRDQAVDDHLQQYMDTLFIIHSISQVIKDQGIENIMMGGNEADDVVTYNTFMYHGASGSPVFDACCKVFGLHSAGYFYGFPRETKNVIEFARPLLTIFGNFVRRLKKKEDEDILKRVEEEAEANQHLEKVLKSVLNDPEEPMDVDKE
ncbi:protein FAM111A-like isoform X2 [Anabas testudineus]|uniref:protein FAM111A-like isoform X2 n=1 Tax=Anabas testudineus TaxID=64144 RepID=UPI000E45B622|nr:protein FAM111A-like isoform X2 [Anabas testudineus]